MAIKRAPHADNAEARAKAKVGTTNRVGMCAHEVIVNILGIPAPWKWGGNGRAWAYNYFLGAQKVVKTNDPMKVPAGAVVIHRPRPGATTTGGKAGHIAISAGGGYEYSTDLPHEGRWGKVKISYVEDVWGKELAGYVLVDGMGYDVSPPARATSVAVWGKPETFVLGATGSAVTRLGERIVVWSKALGLPNPYRTGPSSPLTATDVAALAKIQRAWGDHDADGYPGPLTFARLALDPSEPKTSTVNVLFLPTGGYNADDAKGVTRWKSNTDGLAALVNRLAPDLVGTTEMSNRKVNPMLPRFTAALPRYAREPGGSDGRYWFRKNATTDHVASGHVVASELSELNDDDKQGAWTVVRMADGLRVQAIVAHTENEDGIDRSGPNKGADADDLRVTQSVSILSRSITAGAEHKPDVVIYVGDFNSEKRVKDEMIRRGWKVLGPGVFTRWDDTAHKEFDWGFIKVGSATVDVINHSFGDHTALLIRWTITKEA